MMRITFIFLLLFLWQCTSSDKTQEPIYIYDAKGALKVYDFKDYLNDEKSDSAMIRYIFERRIKIPKYVDTLHIGDRYKYYSLNNYLEYYRNNDLCKDTTFFKHKSFLKDIDFYDNNWLDDKKALEAFWEPVKCWRCSGVYDSTKIFLILPIKDVDSLRFIQVHRWFHESID